MTTSEPKPKRIINPEPRTEKVCVQCGKTFMGLRRSRCCSQKCNRAAWASKTDSHCDCGQPASKRTGSGFICERCEAIEKRRDQWERDRFTKREAERKFLLDEHFGWSKYA